MSTPTPLPPPNDYARFRALMADFGVELEETNEEGCWTLTMDAMGANSGKLRGYPGFQTVWVFMPDGSFDHVGLWE